VKGHVVVTGIACATSPVLVAVTWGCLWAACATAAPEGGGRQRIPATHDLPAIREGIRQARLRLRDLLVEYLFNYRLLNGQLSTSTSRTVLATRGPLRYIRLTHFDDRMPEELDITENEAFFTGKTYDVFYRRSRYYETLKENPERSRSGPLRGDLFLESLGWWPPEDTTRPPQGQHPFYLHQALDEPGYVVLPFQEEHGGALCHVVERPGVDRLWIDPEIGFALRGRLLFTGQSPRLVTRYELSDFRQAGPGIWVPWRLQRVAYKGVAQQGGEGPQVQHDDLCSVVRVQVNDVPEELFRFTPLPGTLIQDRDANKTWQVPGGLSFLDEVAAIARRRLDVYGAYNRDPSHRADAAACTWRAGAIAGLVVLLGLMNLAVLVRVGRRLLAPWPGPAHEEAVRGPCAVQDQTGADQHGANGSAHNASVMPHDDFSHRL
jgi:hypothetical protein